jgi:superfamily I DNA and/or RNA helicase
VAIDRQRAALDRARLARGERLAELRDVLLGERPPRFVSDRGLVRLSADSARLARESLAENTDLSPSVAGRARLPFPLNAVQREAVEFALSAEDVALIQGPPGTGKTTAVVELIRRAAAAGQRVLASAPSNLAVDNIFERLLAANVKAVRLGHPARVLPELRAHTLDLLVEGHDDVRLARRLVKEAMGLFRKAGRTTRARPAPGERRENREEARRLLDDARRLEARAVEHVLDQAEVLCATTTGIDSDVIGPRRFDLAVIDEACQSTEPGSWIPILRAERVVLVGDHCQLPPTVVSAEAAAQGFGVSLFERLAGRYGSGVVRRLTVQYRMHQDIMRFSSREFYADELTADASVATHRLGDLPGVASGPLAERPVEFIDTAGAGYDEEVEPDGESRLNRQEAMLAAAKVGALLAAGVAAGDVAVIAPYAAQVRLIRQSVNTPGVEIDSVDGFQGREKEAVVFSLVRSNPAGEIGFLADVRRTNVALTRARRKLIVIGDSATLAAHPFYRRMLEYFDEIGAYGTVWEQEMGV